MPAASFASRAASLEPSSTKGRRVLHTWRFAELDVRRGDRLRGRARRQARSRLEAQAADRSRPGRPLPRSGRKDFGASGLPSASGSPGPASTGWPARRDRSPARSGFSLPTGRRAGILPSRSLRRAVLRVWKLKPHDVVRFFLSGCLPLGQPFLLVRSPHASIAIRMRA